MVWVSVKVAVGGTKTPLLVKLVNNSSPLAAVHVLLVSIAPAIVTVQLAVTVNRPRWVALPVASRWWLLGGVKTVSKPSYVPLNGNAEPPRASVAAPAPMALNDVVGALGAAPAHAVANKHKPSATYRMIRPPMFRFAVSIGPRVRKGKSALAIAMQCCLGDVEHADRMLATIAGEPRLI